jgi:hypothetical protein
MVLTPICGRFGGVSGLHQRAVSPLAFVLASAAIYSSKGGFCNIAIGDAGQGAMVFINVGFRHFCPDETSSVGWCCFVEVSLKNRVNCISCLES